MKTNLKNILIIAIVALISISGINNVYALEFTDVNLDAEDMQCVKKMVEAGIITGYTDGTFRPNDKIERCEAIKIINKTFGYTDKSTSVSFTDITKTEWFYDDLLIAIKSNYINGHDDNTFKSHDKITREQFCKILCVILDIKAESLPADSTEPVKIADEISDWAKQYVNYIVALGIIPTEDNNSFRATEDITRLEVCKVLVNYLPQTTPSDSGNTGSSGSTGGGNGSTGNTGSTEGANEELINCLEKVSNIMQNDCIPALDNENLIEICNDIYQNMTDYLEDNSHNYEAAAERVYQKYNSLSEEEQNQLETLILSKNTLQDILMLKNWFFPDVSI